MIAARSSLKMPSEIRMSFLDDECLMIRSSGEIPEVALHNALHYLTLDPEGPRLNLQPEEIRRLHAAVIRRYRRIVLRDLDPRLRDKSVYRGIERSITNGEWLSRFAARERFDLEDLKNDIAMDPVRMAASGQLRRWLRTCQ